jgi:hypothetical protein
MLYVPARIYDMSETQLLMVASSIVATLFGLLVTIIGWLGNKFYAKLDEISKNLVVMAGELHDRINGLDHQMQERINGLDRRVTRVETQHEDRRK